MSFSLREGFRNEALFRTRWVNIALILLVWLIVIDATGFSGSGQKYLSVIAVQTLVFFAGYLEKGNKTLKGTAINGIKPLLLPYFFFQAVLYVYYIIIDIIFRLNIFTLGTHETRPLLESLFMPILNILLFGYSDQYFMMLSFALWCLPALFLVRILHTLILLFSKKNRTLYFTGIVILLLLAVVLKNFRITSGFRFLFCIDSAFLLLPFFVLGKTVKKMDIMWIDTLNALGKILLMFFTGIIGMLLISTAIKYHAKINPIAFSIYSFGNSLILYLFLSLVGLLSIVIFSLICARIITRQYLFLNYAIIILALHGILVPYINAVFGIFELKKGLFAAASLAAFNISVFIIPVNTIEKYMPSLSSGRELGLGGL